MRCIRALACFAVLVVAPVTAQEPASELTSVSVGSAHACGVHPSGDIYCWGNNRYGQLGNGVAVDSELPPARVQTSVRFRSVSAGATHSCALAVDGSAYCWGTDMSGVLGDATLGAQCMGMPCTAVPTRVAPDLTFDALSAGHEHSCALRDGRAYCWGRNQEGQLGRQPSGEECDGVPCGRQALPVDTELRFREVSVSGRHSCALGEGMTFCWGDNSYGQLDAPRTIRSSSEPLRVSTEVHLESVSTSGLYSCGLTAAGRVICWGTTPLGSESGVALFPEWKGARFVAVGAGGTHSCALGADGGVYCWGIGRYNRLGSRVIGKCDGLPCSRVPVKVPLPSKYAKLSVGGTSACAIAPDRVTCWGGSAGESGLAEMLASAAPLPR